MPTQITTMEDAEALILGLGLFATGGGGLADRGRGYMRELLDDGIEVSWTSIDELDADLLTCSVYGMGSIAPRPPMTDEERAAFGVRGTVRSRPWVTAVDELEEYLGTRVGAIIPFELGPSNTLVAVDAAARSGRALVDGDYIGRALPKMSQALPALHGFPTWPLAICDPWGNTLLLKDCASPAVAERIGKMVSKVTKAVDMGASCSHAAFPVPVSLASTALVPGTLSRSLEVGRQVLAARVDGRDPIEAALRHGGGTLLFSGTVEGREWEDSAEGYMEGVTHLVGTGVDEGRRGRIWFQNEHHLFWRDDELTAMSPDIISVVTAPTAEPLSNTEIAEGDRVAVLAFPADVRFRSGEPLRATEPRAYGFEIDYRPLEELHPPTGTVGR